jgi:tetratricopeptide (TPR) repeat protein
MSHSARILPFPSRYETVPLSAREAATAAHEFLATEPDLRSDCDLRRSLGSPEILLSICAQLRQMRDLNPAVVERDASQIYTWISNPAFEVGLFDERDYFLGETALVAGGACRQLGKRDEALLWLDRAEAGFRHTMNPAPGLANVAYARLALRFEMGRYRDVRELAPSLEASFQKLRMHAEGVKCRLLLAMTLKQCGENATAIDMLEQVRTGPELKSEPFLQARLLTELGDLHQLQGDFSLALPAFQDALNLLLDKAISLAGADLKLYVGGVHRALGSLGEAKDAYREAQSDYAALGMRHLVAYTHLVVAEVLLEMKREREAEWEILAALPAIDEIKMVPEAFAALALLRESVGQRNTNLTALKDLRARLEAAS